MAVAKQIVKSILKQVGRKTPIIGILIDALEDIEKQKDAELLVQIYNLLKEINNDYLSKSRKKLKVVEEKVRQVNNQIQVQDQQASNNGQRNIFLYLASKKYADAYQTNDLALREGFVWRSYYKKNSNQHVNHVDRIKDGDLIVLAYRTKDPTRFGSFFNVLNVFMVKTEDQNKYESCNGIAPFVFANAELSEKLVALKYKKDPRLKRFVGIPLVPKYFEMEQKESLRVYQEGFWKCPAGNDAIWPLYDREDNESPKIPEPVRDWMKTL